MNVALRAGYSQTTRGQRRSATFTHQERCVQARFEHATAKKAAEGAGTEDEVAHGHSL